MLQVLVVERDPVVGHLYNEELKDAGFQVKVARGLDEALNWLRGKPVDVVVTDQASCERPRNYWLPQLRKLHHGPVVVLSPRCGRELPGDNLWEVLKSSDLTCLITSLRKRVTVNTWGRFKAGRS